MNFQLPNQLLSPLLRRLTAIVSSKPMIPAHGSIKITSKAPRTVKFYTYSPTIVTEGTLEDVNVTAPFEFGTTVGLFADMIAALPKDAAIDFALAENHLHVKAGRSSFKVNIFTEDMFLPPRDYSLLPYIDIDMKVFVESLKRVSFSVEGDNHERFERTAICINSDHFVATDGHRMSVYPNKLFKTPHNLLVSPSTVDRLQKLYEKPQGRGVFSGSASEITLGYGGVFSSSRLLSGSYPNYRTVIPSGAHTRCLVSRTELLEAVNRVLILMGPNARNVRFTFSENRVDLFASDPQHGEGFESLPCECPGVAEPYILTGRFVLEALKNYTSDKVVFELRSPVAPFIMTDGEHLNVIMPVKPKEPA